VVNLDPTLGQEFFDIAGEEPVPELPTHRQDDDLGRGPEALER
jgi:hypothetical protein